MVLKVIPTFSQSSVSVNNVNAWHLRFFAACGVLLLLIDPGVKSKNGVNCSRANTPIGLLESNCLN